MERMRLALPNMTYETAGRWEMHGDAAVPRPRTDDMKKKKTRKKAWNRVLSSSDGSNVPRDINSCLDPSSVSSFAAERTSITAEKKQNPTKDVVAGPRSRSTV